MDAVRWDHMKKQTAILGVQIVLLKELNCLKKQRKADQGVGMKNKIWYEKSEYPLTTNDVCVIIWSWMN